MQEEIAELVSRICADVQALQEEHAAALEVLSSLAADLRQGKEAAAAEEALPLLEQVLDLIPGAIISWTTVHEICCMLGLAGGTWLRDPVSCTRKAP